MAYAPEIIERRRCKAIRIDGNPCQAFSLFGSPVSLCAAHAGLPRRPYRQNGELSVHKRSRAVCYCDAYQWPHRAAGGLCRYPYPPTRQHPTPAGTHSIHFIENRRLKRVQSWLADWIFGDVGFQ